MKTLTPVEIAALQSALNRELAAGLNHDGEWGPRTDAAFRKWARLSSAPPDPVAAPAAAAPEFADNAAAGAHPEFDARSERLLGTLLPPVRETFRKLLRVAKRRAADFGCDVRIIQGSRTYAEQEALHAKGRTLPGPVVTNARGGHSNHNFGIAVDLGVFRGGDYLDERDPKTAERVHRAVADAVGAERLPLEWGGVWTSLVDLPHWEYATGLSIAQKRALVAKGKTVV